MIDIDHKAFEYQGRRFHFDSSHYMDATKREAIIVKDDINTPYIVLTINKPECPLEEDEVLVKTYAENYDIANYLRDGQYFEDTGKRFPLGWVDAEIWKKKDDRAIIDWNTEKLKQFQKAYSVCEEGKTFTFEGHEFLKSYAKYLIEFLKMEFKIT